MHKSMETAPLDEPLPAGSATTGDQAAEPAVDRERLLEQTASMNIGAARPGDTALSRHPDTPLPSFEALFETYYRPLASFLFRMLGDLQLAQDITQDCFVKLHLAIKNGQALENVRAWLYRVATNAALDERRRRKRIAWLPLLGSSERNEDFLDPEEQVILRDRLQQVLAGISPNLSVCLLLHLHHGFSHDEIASILGISSGAARTRLQRAREAFKARWLTMEERSSAGRSTAARQNHSGKRHGAPPRDRSATDADQQHGGHTTHESHAI